MLALAAPGVAQQDPRYEEEIEVHSFDVEVMVRDRAGKSIPDLREEDFVVLVNGRNEEITSFARVRGGRLVDVPGPEERRGEEAAPTGEAEPVTWAIFVDPRGVRGPIRNAALRQLAVTLDELFVPGDRGILAAFSESGLRVLIPLTDSKQDLADRLKAMQRERLAVGPVDMRASSLRTEIERGQAAGDELNSLIELEFIRTKNAIRALGSFFDILAGGSKRVAVVYVGPGLDSLPVMSLVEAWRARNPGSERDPRAPRPEEKQPLLEAELGKLAERVAASRATAYAIYVGDRHQAFPDVDDVGGGAADLPPKSERAHWSSSGQARVMAESTGGRLFTTTPALGRQLTVVGDDLRNYYLLGFARAAAQGETLRVDVRVNVEGARVSHRNSVRRRADEEITSELALSALFDPAVAANPLGARIEIAESPDSRRGRPLLRLTVTVPTGSPGPDPAVRLDVGLAGDDGAVWRLEGRTFPIDPAAPAEARFSIDIPRPKGAARMAVVVEDRASRTRSVLTAPLPRR